MELVSVILATCNDLMYLKGCLKSINRQTYKHLEVIIIDNHSTDGTPLYLKSNHSNIRLIENGSNLGFCHANNQGIREAKGDYIFFLNSDATLEDNFIEEMLKELGKDSSIGSASGKILRSNRTERIIDSTGIQLNRFRLSPKDRGQNQQDIGQFEERENIFGPSGAAAFYRRKTLEDVKVGEEYLDEEFFAYYEDLDLAWRAQLYGWKSIYVPGAIAYHSRKGPERKPREIYRHSFKNRYLCTLKNELTVNFLKYFPISFTYELIRCLRRLFTAPYLLRSFFITLRLLPTMLKKRRLIQKRRKVRASYLGQFK